MTDEQIDSMVSATIIKPVFSGGETTKNTSKTKTPLEIQVSTLSLKIRNSKLPLSSDNWLEAIFDNVESILDKAKVGVSLSSVCQNIVILVLYLGVYCNWSYVCYPVWSA